LNNGGQKILPNGTHINKIKFNLSPNDFDNGLFPDDVRFVVQIIKTTLPTSEEDEGSSIIWYAHQNIYDPETGTVSGGDTGPISIPTADPDAQYSVYCFVESDVNVDWDQIKWKPTLTTTEESNTVLPVDYKNYNDNINHSRYWLSSNDLIDPVEDEENNDDGDTRAMQISQSGINWDNLGLSE